MRLRPHHLLCTQGYIGKGYNDSFVKNMDAITLQFRNEESTSFELVFSTDSLCEHCPNKFGRNLCKDNDKVNEIDQKVITYFNLKEQTYVYQDLIREINEKMTAEMMNDICGKCEWYHNSPCKDNILKRVWN